MNDPSQAFGVATMSQLREALALSQARERRAHKIIETAPDAIIVVDQAGLIVLVNEQTERLFGYSRDELLGKPVEILVPDHARAGHESKRTRFVGAPSTRPMGLNLDLSGRRKDGSDVPIEISLSPMHTEEGVLVSAAIRDTSDRRQAQRALHQAHDELDRRVRDRTAELETANAALRAEMADRHRAESALLQAQKMEAVGQLTGGVAHDFNNLLTVVMGNLQLLAMQLGTDANGAELIRAALKACQRGADLNRTLLAFSRKQRLAPQPVNLNEKMVGMAEMLGRTLGEQIRIKVKPEEDLPVAIADPTQLETALLNLAVNARDAMPDGGTLLLETSAVVFDALGAALEGDVQPGRYVMLAVSDTGSGMPPEVAARAFEPFFTTKETAKGSGLGLAMVYGFVKQSGGHVKIYSEPGLGTTIKIFLPQVTSADIAAPETAVVHEPHPTGDETILVVEDEEDVRILACRLLAGLGYSVMWAEDGLTALSILEQSPEIELLFSDVVLPGGMNGLEIGRRARESRPDLKVLYTSGYTGNAIQQFQDAPGEVRLLSKPYAIDELARMIRTTLDS